MNDKNPSLPLAGIKVLELARVAAGPYAALMLADLGADVIKVEPPGGDESRRNDLGNNYNMSGYFFGLNRGKRSVVADLRDPAALDMVLELARDADVFIENFRLGTADKLGVGYSALAEINPRLVYCSISGFGEHGPLRARPAYDLIAQAVTGLMGITGGADGKAVKCGPPVIDIICGTIATSGIMAALLQRTRTGAGQHVHTSLIGAGLTFLAPYLPSYALGTQYQRLGTAHTVLAPYQSFEGADGREFVVACGNDSFWNKLTAVIGRDDLAADPRFASNGGRSSNRKELAAALQATFSEKPASHWVEGLQAADIPASYIYGLGDVTEEEHYRINGFVRAVHEPAADVVVPAIYTPLAFSAAERAVGVSSPPPRLDQHGDEIRSGNGFRATAAMVSTERPVDDS